MNFEVRGLRLSGSFLSIVLAMALLGPAPAVALGVASVAVDCAAEPGARSTGRWSTSPRSRRSRSSAASRSSALRGDFDPAQGDALGFAGVVLAVFMATNVLNFADGRRRDALRLTACSPRDLLRSFVTALPSEFATGLLTASVAFTYGHLGMASVALAAVILFVFLYILQTSVQADERGEQLEQRTRELASLQMGLLSTVLQTLSMRDA